MLIYRKFVPKNPMKPLMFKTSNYNTSMVKTINELIPEASPISRSRNKKL